MLTEMVEYRCKIKEEVKAMQSEIQKNIQGTNSEGKKTGTKINDLEQKEEKTFNWNRMKKKNPKESKESKRTRIQKNKERLRNLWDNFKCSNI